MHRLFPSKVSWIGASKNETGNVTFLKLPGNCWWGSGRGNGCYTVSLSTSSTGRLAEGSSECHPGVPEGP